MLHHALAPVLALTLAAAPAPTAAPTPAFGGPSMLPPTTVMTPASTVAARTDRRPVAGGVYDAAADTTFIAWGGQHEDNYVQAFDHRTRTWSPPVYVASGDNDSH